MYKNTKENNEIRYFTADEGADYYRVSPLTFRKLGKSIGAERRIGKRCIYDKKVVDDYLAKNDTYED